MLNKRAALTPHAYDIIVNKATEAPGTGIYNLTESDGTYLCRQCGLALFRSSSKFISACGWPSFDDEIANSIQRHPDADGRRTEICCARCDGHLGHVFHGEGFTSKNLRHCVNALSLDFVEDLTVQDSEEAIFAGGCFWGVEYYLQRLPGVLLVESGYIGGHSHNPSYQEVCRGNSGHLEAVRVLFDCQTINYETVAKCFFEIHDPTQRDGQGPDIGEQYQSAVFCFDEQQKAVINDLIAQLSAAGYKIATRVLAIAPFWRAETEHQNYYNRHNKQPYCHGKQQRPWQD